ncbi:MAG: aminoglycoside phosphotransferase family protein [Actinoplanes sp.]
MDREHVLQDTPHRLVSRVGDTVRRPVQPWSGAVHELLLHLEAVGFEHAPRFLGIDAEGREVLSYLEGESGPDGWAKVVDESGLTAMARLLRDYHEAVRGFRPTGAWAGRDTPPGPGELICHGDYGPWNLTWAGTRPAGILDFDYAWPAPPLFDVAYALEYVAPFRSDEECRRWLRYPAPPDRRRRLELFATAYGLTSFEGLADAVIAQQEQVWHRARQLAAEGRQPQAEWQATGFLDQTADRIEWSRAHRQLFA